MGGKLTRAAGRGDVPALIPPADFTAVMAERDAVKILVQSAPHEAGTVLVQGDGIYVRRDRVVSALQNTAAWVAEGLAGFQGVYPSRGLIRALDAGRATKAEQLMAALSLRLMNQPEPEFSGLRITIEAGVDGQVHLHTQGFNMWGSDTQRVLDAALDSLRREIADFKRCPFHTHKERAA